MRSHIGTTSMNRNIVLLRGLARGSRHWGGFVEAMAAHFSDDNIVAIDLAGNGLRYTEPSPVEMGAAVNDIRLQLSEQGLMPPYYVLAMSLGGMVSLSWMADDKAKPIVEVASALIINTSHAKYSPVYQRMRPLALQQLLMSVWMPAVVREAIVYQLTVNNRNAGLRKRCVKQWAMLQHENPVSINNFYRQLTLARSFHGALKINPERCVLLASTNDRLVNPMCSQKLSRRFGLSVCYHGSAGHDIPLDDPKWVIEQAEKQFNRVIAVPAGEK